MEIDYIKYYDTTNPNNGYNCSTGGEHGGTGVKWTDKRKRMQTELYSGKNHPLYGSKMSDETKQRISKAHMGKQMSDEAKHNMAIAQTGRKHTEEDLRKMSIAQKGHKGLTFTEEDLRYRSKMAGGDVILQFSLTGAYINDYISSHAVENAGYNRANIVKCCKHKYCQSNGYIWIYQQEYIKNGDQIIKDIIYELNHRNIHKAKYKPVIQMDKNYNFVKQYDNLTLASIATKIPISSISAVCKGREHYHTAGGYIWKYAEQVIHNEDQLAS